MDRREFLRLGSFARQGLWVLFVRSIQRLELGVLCDEIVGKSIRLRLTHTRRLPALVKIVRDANATIHVFSGQDNCVDQACPVVYLDIRGLTQSFDESQEVKSVGPSSYVVPSYAPVGFFQAKGFEQFDGLEPSLSLLDWIAQPKYHDFRPFYLPYSGVERLQILLADGSSTVVGDFGVDAKQSIALAHLHQIVPKLFMYLHDPVIRKWFDADEWPLGLYRLDALERHVSIARFFLGHQYRLMWPLRCVISKGRRPQSAYLLKTSQEDEVDSESEVLFEIMQIKGLFDEKGVWAER